MFAVVISFASAEAQSNILIMICYRCCVFVLSVSFRQVGSNSPVLHVTNRNSQMWAAVGFCGRFIKIWFTSRLVGHQGCYRVARWQSCSINNFPTEEVEKEVGEIIGNSHVYNFCSLSVHSLGTAHVVLDITAPQYWVNRLKGKSKDCRYCTVFTTTWT